ncbi:type II toxin-antitoxin system HipA family toxin [Paraliomyxa miuraensis]|uniref:type II toxin-antitoxin system HipA family toxin n=1 Tax=Paraliomyxa miuraensis TaxID=376150 RepID=UPI002253102F|nr:HipA domain-containing protein [Paraliomyxa miuraensis]MCX4239367.1 HipA domain-containing protein [Paraliomyxa miuraensis]
MSARVLLGDVVVGDLRPDTAAGQTTLEFDASYATSASRPVLGRWFEDQLIEPPRRFRGTPLPNYFRNLLPEGALRKIVERRLGTSEIPEYTMLLRLGENLPGAVRVISDELDLHPLEAGERQRRDAKDPFRFALTGVQPKLALSEVDDRLTMPVEGANGHWIAKLGSPAYQCLVDNEFAMLEWAQRCGLDVPEHRIVRASEIEDIPADFDEDQDVLLVRRFDRDGDRRIHQEDFAQVFDIPPEERYAWEVIELEWVHYGSIGAVIHALCGEHDFQRYMRRLAFMVLSGNADAHLKNWSLLYPDGVNPRLAPVYDVVSTVVYPSIYTYSSLRWLEPLQPTLEPPMQLADVTLDNLLEVASLAPADTSRVMDDLEAFVRDARDAWPDIAAAAPPVVSNRVTKHLAMSSLR